MPILIVTYLIQIFLIIHVMRTGRSTYWIWVLLMAPFLGGLAYVIVEILPGSRTERKVARLGRNLVKAVNPDMDLRKRAQELEICGSTDNKLKLAEECLDRGMPEDALHLYESAAIGPYANDARIRHGIAQAALANGDLDKSAAALDFLQNNHPQFKTNEIELLQIRLLVARSQFEAALPRLERLIPIFTGLEARYLHGEILVSTNARAAAIQVFEGVLVHAKRFKIRHEEELFWVKQARKQLAELKA